MSLKAISRNVGAALLVSALFMFFSILVSIANGNDSALAALLISFTITFIVGIFPFIFVRKAPLISIRDGYAIIVLAWLLSFIFGMMPYLLWGGPFTVINALFESVSGFTTTGATILNNVQALPNSLLFWRSSTHFIGGLGVVVFLLLIIPSSNPMRLRLTNMELSSLVKDTYSVKANKVVVIFAYVYFLLNLASFLLYWIAGMSAFDAINHAFSVCSTGGFSTKNLSIAAFHSVPIDIITMIFMYLSSIHFALIYFTLASRSLRPLRNPVLNFYNIAIIIGIIIVVFNLKFSSLGLSWQEASLQGSFQMLSFISTTGFAIADNTLWPLSVNMTLFMFTFMCGCAGSTVGGIKADRIYLLFMSIKRQVINAIHPNAVSDIKIAKHVLDEDELKSHLVFIALFLLIFLFSAIFSLYAGVDIYNAICATVSTMSNVGPGMGAAGTLGNYNSIPFMGKFIFVMDMFLGRLEFYPIFIVLTLFFTKKNK